MRDRCGRCGRFLVSIEYPMHETSEVDVFEECTNPTCKAAEDAALADWYSRVPQDDPDVECGNRKSPSAICTLQAGHTGDHCDFENPMAGQWR